MSLLTTVPVVSLCAPNWKAFLTTLLWLADLDSALPEGSIPRTKSGRPSPGGDSGDEKRPHCLGDLLMKANYGGLDVDIAAVIGNHDTLPLVGGALWYSV
ncbi:formyltetrahydrofolate deformylase [Klebsiella pneumoniae]|nr:formyltetrahydrofolate deformylase [Klebsiella pneumoniae]